MFRLEIRTGNAAFVDPFGDGIPYPELELARILRELANRLERDGIAPGFDSGSLFDVNGDGVGFWSHTA